MQPLYQQSHNHCFLIWLGWKIQTKQFCRIGPGPSHSRPLRLEKAQIKRNNKKEKINVEEGELNIFCAILSLDENCELLHILSCRTVVKILWKVITLSLSLSLYLSLVTKPIQRKKCEWKWCVYVLPWSSLEVGDEGCIGPSRKLLCLC